MLKDPTGIILIIIGILFLIKPFITVLVTIKNRLRGVQTSISDSTILFYRSCGVAMIVVGCIMYFGKK